MSEYLNCNHINKSIIDVCLRVTRGLIVKEACPVGSCPATMEVAVHSPQEGLVAHAHQVLVGYSVNVAAVKVAQLCPAAMEDYALKRPLSHTSTVSVPVDGKVNGVSSRAEPLTHRPPRALWQSVMAKLMMVFATSNVTHYFAAGMVVTAL